MTKKRTLSKRLGAILRGLILWPVVGVLGALNIRFAIISNPGRIGHVAAEVDCFLKERALNMIPQDRTILLLDRNKAANAALIDVFRQRLTIWSAPWLCKLLFELAKFPAVRRSLGRPVTGFGEAARYAQVNWLWGDRPPTVSLPSDLVEKGRDAAARMGLPDGAWFVAAHAREGGYSPRDEADHAHRNARIGSFSGAFQAIRDAGGWVIRVGDPTMTPLPATDGVIDYATSPHKTDWMDLWLIANCRFLVGTTSGLAMLATLFGRPCALVNMVPQGAGLGMWPQDVSIPKRMMRNGDEVTIPEAFRDGLSAIRYARLFEEKGVTVVENTDDEIRALTQEMIDRLAGTFQVTPDDEDLQRRFKAEMRPIDYAFGAMGRIGRDWLRENRRLLGD